VPDKAGFSESLVLILKKTRVIVLLSGGIDSAACLHYYLDQRFGPTALFINYGQAAAKKECESAKNIAQRYSVCLDHVKADFSQRFGQGEIIGRNAFFLFTALVKYFSFSGLIGIGIHSGAPYYDTSAKFIRDTQLLFDEYTSGRVRIDAPFLRWDKGMIYTYSRENSVPLKLTYSCELGGKTPCKKCSSCLDRLALGC